MEKRGISIAWFERENFERLVAIFTDEDEFPQTYDDWLQKAENIQKNLERLGDIVIRVDVNPDKFLEWCRDNGFSPNAKARAEYAMNADVKSDG